MSRLLNRMQSATFWPVKVASDSRRMSTRLSLSFPGVKVWAVPLAILGFLRIASNRFPLSFCGATWMQCVEPSASLGSFVVFKGSGW